MGWTSGDFSGRLTAKAAIAFALGEEFLELVLAAMRDRDVVYAAVQSGDSKEVWALVLILDRRGKRLCAKPIGEEMGPFDDHCPPEILDLLTAPSNDLARHWRNRCRARLSANIVRQNGEPTVTHLKWARSATKHRISRQRSRHVVENCGLYFEQASSAEADRRLVILGDDMNDVPLEVMAVELEDGGLLVIHAMPLRDRYRMQYEEARKWRR